MITGSLLRDALISGANHVAVHRHELNKINVFPVPDGDTGANMSVTLGAARAQLLTLPDDCHVSEAAAAAADTMLRASRGNSGAILTLLLRGFARSLKHLETADTKALSEALQEAVAMAYAAVRRPTEGTMLTVARESSRRMKNYLLQGEVPLSQAWELLCSAARQSLSRTPLLEVLEEEGVIDAGGLGLCYLFEGMGSVFAGKGIVPAPERMVEDSAFVFMEKNLPDVGREAVLGYKISFDMAPDSISESELHAALDGLVESLVAVATRASLHARAFTNHPMETLAAVLNAGTLLLYRAEAHSACNKVTFPAPEERLPANVPGNVSLPCPYCTEFTILKDAHSPALGTLMTDFLDAMGESVVVIEGEEVLKCHVHTAQPQELFSLKLPSGYVDQVKIEHMAWQQGSVRG